MKKKLILFDFDGTVIDNSEGIYKSILYALKKLGREPLGEDDLRKFIGPSLYDGYLANCEDNKENANRFVELYRERYAPVGYTEVKLYPGMKELLCVLKSKGRKVAVCSSKPIDFVKKISEHLGIYKLFDHYFCPGFGSTASSKTEFILEAMKYYDVTREETLMIGDRKYDIEAAKEAHVESAGVLYGFAEDGELQNAGADFIAEDLKALYPVIVR